MKSNTHAFHAFILVSFLLLSTGASYGSSKVHDFTGFPLTDTGWTDLTALIQPSSRIVYLSNSGDDATARHYSHSDFVDPLNPDHVQAYSTLSEAYNQLRDGFPDVLLLKRGDVWDANWPNWRKSGKSKDKPIIVGAYGDESLPRPKTGRFNIYNTIDYCIFSSLELDADERSINVEKAMSHILFEDIMSPPGTGKTGVIIQNIDGYGGIDYLAIRRCVVAGRFRPEGNDGYNQGIFIDDAINLLLEENVFDKNGWSADGVDSSNDLRAHNTYITLGRTGNENHIFRYNISTRARSSGIQAGSGGLIYGNLSVQDAIGIQTAREDVWWYDGFGGTVKHNVILHGRDVNSQDFRGFGIRVNNINNMTIEDNIIAHNFESGQPYGIRVEANRRSGVMMYVRNLTIKDNIVHNWNGRDNSLDGEAISLLSAPYDTSMTYHHGSDRNDFITGVTIKGNKLHLANPTLRMIQGHFAEDIIHSANNSFYLDRTPSQWFYIGDTRCDLSTYKTMVNDTTSSIQQTLPSGSYGITDYLSSIGQTATLDSFYTHLRAQRKGNWDTRYTAVPIINFVRDSFDRKPIPEDSIAAPLTPLMMLLLN